jgi:Cu/Ag efflux protein CusF
MNKLIPLLTALTIAAPLHAEPATPPVAQASVMSEGVVRKIDAVNGKITLKHGPIANLDMPAMTMVFRVRPIELLSAVKEGDSVRFHAEQIDGVISVTAITPVR